MTHAIPNGEARVRMRKLVGWGIIGQAGYVASQFLLLLALARFASVAEVGHFGFANALVVPVVFLLNLGMRVNQATDISRRYSFQEFLLLRTIATAVAYLVIVVIAFTAVDAVTRPIILVFGAAKAVEMFSDFFYGIFQRAERLEFVARSLALRGFGSAILFAIILAATGATALAFAAHLVVWVLVAIFVDYLPAHRIAMQGEEIRPARWNAVFEMARSSVSLGVNSMLAALQNSLPRYIIGWVISIVALGQFTVVAYANQAIVTVFTAIGQSITSRLAFYAVNSNRQAFFGNLHKLIGLILVGGLGATLVGLGIGGWLIRTVFGAEYDNLGPLFALCILSATLQACVIILQSGLFAFRDFHLSMILRGFSIGLMSVACFVGAWVGGLIGLSWGMSFTFLIHSIALWLVLQRKKFSEPDRTVEP
ncbi:lipopolysaccharide biosynthesis protein [Amaricoccus sp. B4]|uniref:lipopolysaccharide biosynthesis protein n=1 Tax=Amaricoccus sp. B4 TaxID=3368557 RepID=UPI003719DCE3